jgi:DNA-binding IclR family transcriptional regulator
MTDKSNKETRMYNLILAYYNENKEWPSNSHLCNSANLAIKTVKGILRTLKSDGYIETDYSLNVTGCAFMGTRWLSKPMLAA